MLLTNLAVDPEARRRNLGRRLVQQVVAAADTRTVVLEVEQGNDAAISLYRACGFETVSTKSGTRYEVDWWRGRIKVETALNVMRRSGGAGALGEPASTDTCDTSDPTGLCVSE